MVYLLLQSDKCINILETGWQFLPHSYKNVWGVKHHVYGKRRTEKLPLILRSFLLTIKRLLLFNANTLFFILLYKHLKTGGKSLPPFAVKSKRRTLTSRNVVILLATSRFAHFKKFSLNLYIVINSSILPIIIYSGIVNKFWIMYYVGAYCNLLS